MISPYLCALQPTGLNRPARVKFCVVGRRLGTLRLKTAFSARRRNQRSFTSPLGRELALALVCTEPPDCVLDETHAPYRGAQTNVGAGHYPPPPRCV